jgi:hypothetical protein
VPDVLRTPIEHTLYSLIATRLKNDDDISVAARREVHEQLMERYRALFEYYGIFHDTPNAKDMLILMMGWDLFPDGFRQVLKGRKTGVKQKRWTVSARLELLETMELLQSAGMSIEKAAQHICDHKLLPKQVQKVQDTSSIITRYHEAKKLMERIKAKDLTPAENLELLAFHYEVKLPASEEESTD